MHTKRIICLGLSIGDIMKINNKGVTLLEMLVTVALLSVMMIFMYKLLNGISFEKDNEFFSSKNQDLRVQIIDRLEVCYPWKPH